MTHKRPLRILVSNDDGIMSRGLQIAVDLAQKITPDVWVVAPHDQRSGTGQSITWGMPIRMHQIGPQKYAVKGTPADCIILALSQLMKDQPPDFIFSGINYGENIAESVTVSGTIGAAMQGTIQGIPSLALSQASVGVYPPDWSVVEAYGEQVVHKVINCDWPANTLMNVNFPHKKRGDVKGIRVLRHGRRSTVGDMVEALDPHGRPSYWVGILHREENPPQDTDLWGIQDGFITITPITLDLTNYTALPKIAEDLTADF